MIMVEIVVIVVAVIVVVIVIDRVDRPAFVVAVELVLGFGAQCGFLGGVLRLLAQQRVAILLGDLIVIGVDLAEREEAVAIAAVIDERRLQRRLDPGNLG